MSAALALDCLSRERGDFPAIGTARHAHRFARGKGKNENYIDPGFFSGARYPISGLDPALASSWAPMTMAQAISHEVGHIVSGKYGTYAMDVINNYENSYLAQFERPLRGLYEYGLKVPKQ